MFRKISISLIFAAITLLIAHSVVPHHEHGDAICFEEMHCSDSKEQNNASTTQACCLDKQDIIRAQNEIRIGSECEHGSMCDYHFPPIILFLGNFFDLCDDPVKIDDILYLNLYTSAELYSVCSLRGPPQA